jgi:DivIVA domain-containing protein
MMDLTPLDVRKKKGDFARALRGYEPSAVDGFLDVVADRLDELVRASGALAERVKQLNESLEAFRQRENAMNEALISAQQLREDMRAQTERDAELTLREAQVEAERIVAEGHREVAQVTESLKRLQAARVRFLRGFRGYLERQMEDLSLEEERAGLRRPASEAGGSAGAGRVPPSAERAES